MKAKNLLFEIKEIIDNKSILETERFAKIEALVLNAGVVE